MTHTLTHTGKGADADNGAKSVFDLILLEQRWPESVENQGLEGPQPVGKDEVGGSNPPSSSKKKDIQMDVLLFGFRRLKSPFTMLGRNEFGLRHGPGRPLLTCG